MVHLSLRSGWFEKVRPNGHAFKKTGLKNLIVARLYFVPTLEFKVEEDPLGGVGKGLCLNKVRRAPL